MSVYGQGGVERAIKILKDEFTMVMRLMGVSNIGDIKKEMVCTKNLKDHITPGPKNYLWTTSYDRLKPPDSKL
jgi:L-lactate dehydrogenase (cytochrome)